MSAGAPEPALYVGQVMHARLRPVRHKFSYRVFSLLLDVDAVGRTARALRLFRHNRPGLIAFYDRDHAARDGAPLRPWVEARLREAGCDADVGAIRLLCFPRILGYVFNPLSVYFCYAPGGGLSAIVYQVHNTFGGSHAYVCPVVSPGEVIDQQAEKTFYVSPFIEMEGRYAFRLRAPGDLLAIAIRESGRDGPTLLATHRARRRPLTDGALLAAWAAHPLMTLKVMAGIHWEAMRLWLKGVRLAGAPAAPAAAEKPL